jgi:hypothetical protein
MMKKFLLILSIIVGLILLMVLLAVILTPWMDKWRTTAEERAMKLPGDDLFENPARVANRAVTIKASPDKIYPWILQIGADKSGMYSYTWLENLVGCKMAKVEELKPEWQILNEGNLMHMCAGDFAPPPYIVARVLPMKRSFSVTKPVRSGKKPGNSCCCPSRTGHPAWSPAPAPT